MRRTIEKLTVEVCSACTAAVNNFNPIECYPILIIWIT